MLISFLQILQVICNSIFLKKYFDETFLSEQILICVLYLSVNAVALNKWSEIFLCSWYSIQWFSKVVYRRLNIWWVFLVCGGTCAKLTLETFEKCMCVKFKWCRGETAFYFRRISEVKNAMFGSQAVCGDGDRTRSWVVPVLK